MTGIPKHIIAQTKRQHRHVNGFTLVELLIVLALLAMLAGIAVPRMFGMLKRSRLQQSAQQLAKDLTEARLQAIKHSIAYELRFEPDGSNYTIRPRHTTSHTFDNSGHSGSVLSSNQSPANGMSSTSNSPESPSFGDTRTLSGSTMGQSSLPSAPTVGHSIRTRRPAEEIDGELYDGVLFGDGVQATGSQIQVPFALPSPPENQSATTTSQNEFGTRQPKNDEQSMNGLAMDSVANSPSAWTPSVVFYPDGRADSQSIRLTADDGRRIEVAVRGLTGGVTITKPTRTTATDSDAPLDEFDSDDWSPTARQQDGEPQNAPF